MFLNKTDQLGRIEGLNKHNEVCQNEQRKAKKLKKGIKKQLYEV